MNFEWVSEAELREESEGYDWVGKTGGVYLRANTRTLLRYRNADVSPIRLVPNFDKSKWHVQHWPPDGWRFTNTKDVPLFDDIEKAKAYVEVVLRMTEDQ